MNNPDRYPLSWPLGWKRTKHPAKARFSLTSAAARDGLFDELERLGATQVILSTNIPLRQDGKPYANQKEPQDSGVAVYFNLYGQPRVFACDKWDTVRDNIRAVALTINALRGIERWGSSDMLERSFGGFAALPPEASTRPRDWWVVLGVSRASSLEQIRQRFNELVKRHHPDHDGSREAFAEIMAAYEQAKLEQPSV
jgi:hypothetical protein